MAGSRGPKAHARAAVGLGLLLVLGLAPAPAAAGSSLLQPPQRINVGPRNPPPPGIGPEVVGGTTAPIGRFAHQAGMYDYGFACGGSLIRKDVVLTAAHCFSGFDPDLAGMDFTLGSHGAFYYDDYGGGTPYKPAKVVIHPAYTGYDYGGDSEFDAAVVFLKECVKLGPRVATVPLATEEEFLAAANGTWVVSGWGSTSPGSDPDSGMGGEYAEKLQYGLVKYVEPTNPECASLLGDSTSDTMLCAGTLPAMGGGSPPVQDSCQGDSGGPLVFNTASLDDPVKGGKQQDDRLVGIVSWGYGCGQAGYPGVYSHVPHLRAWILQQLDSVKPPCAANATHEFTQASPDRNFVGAPAARKRLPSRSDHTECAARCEKLTAKAVAGGAGEAEGCVAFSVSVEPARPDTARAPRYCNLFTGSVPHRVCGEGDGQDLCAVASEGSYRIRFNAGA